MRRIVSVLVFGSMTIATAATGASYPARPIRIIIPFPPGNTIDIMSRLVGPRLTESLGQNIIVDNRPGANGQLGLELAARAAPDGHTLGAAQGGTLIILPQTHKSVPFHPVRDFVPIAVSTTNYLGLVVHPNARFASVKDMIVYAKANPKRLTFGGGGQATWPHMTVELMRSMGGFSYTLVPYKGTHQAVTDVIGGQIDAAVDGITGLVPHIAGGKVRLIAVTSPTRVPQYPDVPAIAETLPGFDSRGWFGYVAPVGTPPEVVRRLNREINNAMSLPDIKAKLNTAGLVVLTESPEFFAELIKRDYDKYGKLIRELGLSGD